LSYGDKITAKAPERIYKARKPPVVKEFNKYFIGDNASW
jgi:hypothetical protein